MVRLQYFICEALLKLRFVIFEIGDFAESGHLETGKVPWIIDQNAVAFSEYLAEKPFAGRVHDNNVDIFS